MKFWRCGVVLFWAIVCTFQIAFLSFKVPCPQALDHGGDGIVSLVVFIGCSTLLHLSGLSCCQLGVGVGVATMDCWRRRPPDLLFRSVGFVRLLFMYRPLVWACSCWTLNEAFRPDWESAMVWVLSMVWILMEGVLPPSPIT